MRTRTKILLLLGILALASFFRLYHITSTPPGLYPDEAMDGNNALEIVHGGPSPFGDASKGLGGHFQTFYTEDNGREGLYVNILVFFIKAFGNEPWVVRLPAAIAGILTVLGMYFLVAELFKEQGGTYAQTIALLSSFLLATSFWHINFSRIGFRAILAPLCLIWALHFLLRALRSEVGGRRLEKNPSSELRAPSFIYATLAGIIYGFGFYAYIAYRITPLLLLLFVPFFKHYPNFWKKMFLFLAVTFIVALPIGIYFLQHPGDFFGRTSQIAVTNSGNPIGHFAINALKTLVMFNFAGDGNWRHNIAGAPELFWPVGILFLVGIIWSIYYLWKLKFGNSNSFDIRHLAFGISLTLAWFLLALLPAAASDEGIPHALRSILMLPPAIIFAAIGGMWLYRILKTVFLEDGLLKNFSLKMLKSQKKWGFPEDGLLGRRFHIPKVIAIIFFSVVAANAYYSYFVVWAQNPNVQGSFNADYVAIGNQINALPQGTPKYIVVVAGGVLARGIPVPAETVMFVTDSFTTSTQMAHHITYLLPEQIGQIPEGTPSSTIFYVK